ncbi:MAG TPA: baseplate J/gp47 family protein [Ruminiclostridium sp.]
MSETKAVIQARMLSNIIDVYDKTKGSFIYDVEEPVAIELETMSAKVDEILNDGFADTSTSSYLDRIVYEQGLSRKSATKATGTVTVTGVVGAAVTKGELVASDNVNFAVAADAVIPEALTIDVSVECESYGTVGNVPVGAIKYFPKTLEGLQTVNNSVAFTNGYDAETDESLRQRYYDKVRTPATSGNKYHYLNWAKSVTGVGDARVVPLWDGNGTVKVIIINSNKRAADSTLIDSVVAYIEDNRPIGATVTVISATEKAIDVSVTLTIDTSNYTQAQIKEAIETNITNYLKSIAFVETYVSYAKIGGIVLDTAGVIDYSNLLVNSGPANISIADTEIAALGGATVG